MIVLAIAGLILAVVFVAVPALQRNARNNGRQSTLSIMRAEFDTALANNGGRIPAVSDIINRFAAFEASQYTSKLLVAQPTTQVICVSAGGTWGSSGCAGATLSGTEDRIDVKDDTGATAGGNVALFYDVHVIKDGTGGTLTGFDENVVVMILGHKCKVSTSGLTGSPATTTAARNTIVEKGQPSSVAWLYRIEEPNAQVRCDSDAN